MAPGRWDAERPAPSDWDGAPPGSAQSACGAGAGRKKSWPLRVSDTDSCSFDWMIGMRTPAIFFFGAFLP
jgi:hypothetical protein